LGSARAQLSEVETFDERSFSNDFFHHELEFTTCCFDFVERPEADSIMLYFVPNSSVITFDLAPDQYVESVHIDILDFEGGFVGHQPTTAFIIRGAGGDFTFRNAEAIGFLDTVTANVFTLGNLNGMPLGEIVELGLQAANEGNSVFPTEVGAYFDNLTAVVRTFCPGDLDLDRDTDLTDLAALLANYGLTEGARRAQGDLDRDGAVDLSDLAALLSAYGTPCE
jgi:hypothetical protein